MGWGGGLWIGIVSVMEAIPFRSPQEVHLKVDVWRMRRRVPGQLLVRVRSAFIVRVGENCWLRISRS